MDASRERFRHVDRIFDAALDVAPDEREAFLVEACGSDTSLRDRVRTLLAAYDRSSDFLDSPAAEMAPELLDEPPASDRGVPERAGPFRLVREIGAGGMGVVFLAERDGAEFQQRVALKLVRHAGASEAVRRRFLEERRILARLDHPRIAHLIDGGLTSDGQPYFAMELVEGEPIDAYCRARDLPLDQRIDLFIGVCEAVQYAHEHLVIHRDLKPSNILVRPDGQLKLLDFGIAKLLDPLSAAEDAGATQTGVLALTPDYAAPEQVRGQLVTTATDTYALGILLYLLLSGRRPYEARGRTPAELERLVCEVEPPRPSAVAPGGVQRRLRGDLDVIVMKALHKEPARRYSAASALADDLRRFRAALPVMARRDSVTYRARKFVGRNRTVVAAALVTIVALVGATAFSTVQARESRRQRDAALQEVQRQRALAEMQDVLAGDSRDVDGRPLSPAKRIELAEQVLSRQFAAQPWLVVEGLDQLAARLYDMGERTSERAMLARARRVAIDANLPGQLASLECARAYSLVYDDHLDSARATLSAARTALEQAAVTSGIATARCLNAEAQLLIAQGQADSAVVLLRRAVAVAGQDGMPYRQLLNDLASALRAAGRTREATTYQRLVITSLDSAGFRGSDVLPNAFAFLTSSLFELGELATVDSVARAVLDGQSRLPGGYSSGLLSFLYGLAKLRVGELDSADVWMQRSMRDTTEGGGALSAYLPPAIMQLRLEQGRLADARRSLGTLPGGTLVRRVNRSWLTARLRYQEGDSGGALAMLEDSLRAIGGGAAQPPPSMALPYVTAAEWRLVKGDPQGAASLALLGRAAGALDSLAVERSAYVGRAELVRARALHALGEHRAARLAADRAVVALSHGYGADNRYAHAGRALRDSLAELTARR